MSTEPIDIMLEAVEWKAVEGESDGDSDLPYATHFGVLKIGEIELNCVQLNTGQRLITEESVIRFLQGLSA